jgi:thiol-disulfide isomerase/thioredoxin
MVMNTIRQFAAVTVLGILCATVGQTQEPKIVMTHVKYDGLKQEILKQRGKVVIVDFWAHNCLPCRKAFPDFIEMQKKYGGKGLVVISVSIDPVENAKAVASANKFLTDNNSPFRNLLLDEPPDLITKQFEYVSIPFYYVFDRKGKWMRYRAYDYREKEESVLYKDLEKTVVSMLDEK